MRPVPVNNNNLAVFDTLSFSFDNDNSSMEGDDELLGLRCLDDMDDSSESAASADNEYFGTFMLFELSSEEEASIFTSDSTADTEGKMRAYP